MKQTMYLIVWHAIHVTESDWQKMYERLVPIKCRFNEKTREYTGSTRRSQPSQGR